MLRQRLACHIRSQQFSISSSSLGFSAFHRLPKLIAGRSSSNRFTARGFQPASHLSTGSLGARFARISDKEVGKKISKLLLTMPKEEKHLKALQLQRMEKRNKRMFTQPSHIFWQVLGSGGPGAPTSLFLYTDHARYIFNCGEGSQRMTSQMSLPRALAQLEHVFITSRSWRNIGGLPGLCLSARGAGGVDITIHGPPGCMDIYEATKNFILLLEFDVHAFESSDGIFSDGAVKIEEILLKRCSPKEPSPLQNDTWDFGDKELQPYDSSVKAYVCSFNPKPGKLDIDKCVTLGVPPGPLLGELKSGKDVTLENGTVVKSSSVVSPSAPSTSYIVIDIPDSGYLPALQEAKKLRNVPHLEIVFHFSPPEVIQEEVYKTWMSSFPSNVQHVLLNKNSTGLGMIDVSGLQARLRVISPEQFFPPLVGAADDPQGSTFDMQKELFSTLENGASVIQGKAGLKFNVRPHKDPKMELETSMIYREEEVLAELAKGSAIGDPAERKNYVAGLKRDIDRLNEEIHKATVKNSGPLDPTSRSSTHVPADTLLAVLKSKSDSQNEAAETSGSDGKSLADKVPFPRITFLGTGSSIPSKYRNVSCILVEVNEDQYFVLDCGEGSLSQLFRLYGVDKGRQILRNIKAIYVSHQHADHHLGIINLIQERERAFREENLEVDKLFIIATGRYAQFLTAYHANFEPVLSHAIQIKCEHLIKHQELDEYGVGIKGTQVQLIYKNVLKSLCDHVGLSEIVTCRAVHCPHAFCLSFRTSDGYKVVYTGDTRPNDTLVNMARDGGRPDLLIHEATMEHHMIYDAMIKKHSTFTEAIQEGIDCEAKFTLLTHFSQRYSKVPLLDEIEGKPNVGIAFDNMTVHPDNLHLIHHMYPALKRVFWEEIDELNERKSAYVYKYNPEDGGPEDGEEESGHAGGQELPYKIINEKKLLAEKLTKRHEDKETLFKKINRVKERKVQQMKTAEARAAGQKDDPAERQSRPRSADGAASVGAGGAKRSRSSESRTSPRAKSIKP